MALVKLYRVTGDRRYFDLAKFFLDTRGTDHHASKDYADASWKLYNDRPYRQDDKPLVDQTIGEGHAVRGVYVNSAMADMAGMARDAAYNDAIDRIWEDVYSKRAYLTGGLGSVAGTEAFGEAYQLPNRTAYTETCASVGGMLWYHRQFQRTGDGAALDMFERTLYNGYLSGVSIAGDTFFYQNPLESNGGNRSQRSAYFDVACCPANLARLMAQLPSLVYSQRGATQLYVNLFVGSEATATLGDRAVRIAQTTNYPWSGDVAITVSPEQPAGFTLSIRMPGWAQDQVVPSNLYLFAKPLTAAERPVVKINGREVPAAVERGFLNLSQIWKKGDRVEVSLPMRIRRVLAHSSVIDDRGKFAFERGPLVYAFESVDNGAATTTMTIPLDTPLQHEFRPDLLNGLEVITGKAGDQPFMAIPYFAWANRGRGEMRVWIPY
jgi:DUF1680 family protein